jgi:hypothetical protein
VSSEEPGVLPPVYVEAELDLSDEMLMAEDGVPWNILLEGVER